MKIGTKKPAVSTEELWIAYQELGSTIKVAERFGYRGANNVSQRLHNAGYPLRPSGRRRDALDPETARLFEYASKR